jgi:hypothetical protein
MPTFAHCPSQSPPIASLPVLYGRDWEVPIKKHWLLLLHILPPFRSTSRVVLAPLAARHNRAVTARQSGLPSGQGSFLPGSDVPVVHAAVCNLSAASCVLTLVSLICSAWQLHGCMLRLSAIGSGQLFVYFERDGGNWGRPSLRSISQTHHTLHIRHLIVMLFSTTVPRSCQSKPSCECGNPRRLEPYSDGPVAGICGSPACMKLCRIAADAHKDKSCGPN